MRRQNTRIGTRLRSSPGFPEVVAGFMSRTGQLSMTYYSMTYYYYFRWRIRWRIIRWRWRRWRIISSGTQYEAHHSVSRIDKSAWARKVHNTFVSHISWRIERCNEPIAYTRVWNWSLSPASPDDAGRWIKDWWPTLCSEEIMSSRIWVIVKQIKIFFSIVTCRRRVRNWCWLGHSNWKLYVKMAGS